MLAGDLLCVGTGPLGVVVSSAWESPHCGLCVSLQTRVGEHTREPGAPGELCPQEGRRTHCQEPPKPSPEKRRHSHWKRAELTSESAGRPVGAPFQAGVTREALPWAPTFPGKSRTRSTRINGLYSLLCVMFCGTLVWRV